MPRFIIRFNDIYALLEIYSAYHSAVKRRTIKVDVAGSLKATAKPVVYMNIPLDAAVLPVRLLSAQKQNLVISQTPDEIPEPYACAVKKQEVCQINSSAE
jgi:hypothetical protein